MGVDRKASRRDATSSGPGRRGLVCLQRRRLAIRPESQLRRVVLQQHIGQGDHQEEEQPEHHPGQAPAHEVDERDGQRDEQQAPHRRPRGIERYRRRPVALKPLGEQGCGGSQGTAAHRDGEDTAKEHDKDQDVGGQGQEHGTHARDHQAHQDELPPTQAVI